MLERGRGGGSVMTASCPDVQTRFRDGARNKEQEQYSSFIFLKTCRLAVGGLVLKTFCEKKLIAATPFPIVLLATPFTGFVVLPQRNNGMAYLKVHTRLTPHITTTLCGKKTYGHFTHKLWNEIDDSRWLRKTCLFKYAKTKLTTCAKNFRKRLPYETFNCVTGLRVQS